jgi:hypothetical protein
MVKDKKLPVKGKVFSASSSDFVGAIKAAAVGDSVALKF